MDSVERDYHYLIARAEREHNAKLVKALQLGLLNYQTTPRTQ